MDPLSGLPQTRPHGQDNFTTECTTTESVGREQEAVTFFMLISLVVLGYIANIIVLRAVCTAQAFNRVENLMLMNLSATSIGSMISFISIFIHFTYPLDFYGSVYCNFYVGIHKFPMTAEGLTVMCISLERTQRVRFPLVRATKTSMIKKICAIWCSAILLDLPSGFLFYAYDPDIEGVYKCRNTKQTLGTSIPYVIYYIINCSMTFWLPSFWLGRDWIHLVSKLRFLMASQISPLERAYRNGQKQLILHAIIFTSIFILIKILVGTHFFLYKLPAELLSETVTEWVKTWKKFLFSLHMLHGCFYPIIMFALSRNIRKCIYCK